MSISPETTAKLDHDAICSAINHMARPLVEKVHVFSETESTNSFLLKQSVIPGHATICAAESQTAGRGRRGNSWHAAAGQNIMCSLSWGFSHWPETITGLGLAVALSVAERLNCEHRIGVRIKWPNDLLVSGRKLGGILVDVSGEAGGGCNAVIGLGLNIDQADWSTESTGYAWHDLKSMGVKLNRNQLIGQIVSDWVAMLQGFELHGFSPLVHRWNRLSSYADSTISVTGSAGSLVGKMLGVDEAGALLVESVDGEVHRFSDSNLSVRVAA